MIAFIVQPLVVGVSLQLAVGIAVGIAVGVLISQLRSPKVKKFTAIGLLLFSFLAFGIQHVIHADDDFVIQNPCKGLTPSDAEWWIYGCFWP